MWLSRHFLLLLLLAIFLPSGLFAADYDQLSVLERMPVDDGLKKFNLRVEHKPGGKTIGRFYVHTEQPFASRDPKWLQWLNFIHTTTKDNVVARELHFLPGDQFEARIVTESEIALRNPIFRTSVVIIPVRSKETPADQVDLLIVTRDAWTLRVGFNLSGFGGAGFGIDAFTIAVGDANVAGQNKYVGGVFTLRPFFMDIEASYFDPRLASSRHTLFLQQGVILGQSDGSFQGIYGSYRFEMPLWAEQVEWGYRAQVDYDYEQTLLKLVGNKIDTYAVPGTDQMVQRKYRWLDVNGIFNGTRSFGDKFKHNIAFGYGFNIYRPTLLEDFPLSGQAKQQFIRDVLPVSEFESFLRIGYSYFWNRFSTFYNYRTFALAEVLRLGPQVAINTDLGTSWLGGDLNFIRPTLSLLTNVEFVKDALFTLAMTGTTRFQGSLVDNQLTLQLLFISPDLFHAGRILAQGRAGIKWLDRNHRSFDLGGNTGLRGTISDYYAGRNFIATNLEYRSSSVAFWVFRLGGVAFYDSGTAYSDPAGAEYTHSLGIGMRLLIVPLNREVFRLDYGVPLSGAKSGFANSLVTFGFGQAF